ncbi:HNH endonuclease signature motif containing protein [Frankia sp. AgB32]|uniref:HNH endonuclease signature motif containing protein n=1 Tax=Frankia sp. AgB32 TaxID=631119 RepID=UPI0034D515FA
MTEDDRIHGRNYTTQTKNLVALNEILASASTCNICGARGILRSMTVDHKIRKQDGGLASPQNAQFTHPYCNSGYKESMHARASQSSQ